jgi:biotin operon repressor
VSAYHNHIKSDHAQIDEDKETVLSLLRQHRGRDNAISARELAEHTTVAPTTVRDMVADLREEWGVPVASLGSGYFWIESADELQQIIEQYHDEIETKKRRLETITAAFNAHKHE